MKSPDSTPSREDILGAFAVEVDQSRATLERYLREYPQFADDLIDLSEELAQPVDINTAPLTAEDQALIDSAWQHHAAAEQKVAANPMAQLNVIELRDIAQKLRVPRQILAAFREHRVLMASVPRLFMERLAELLGTPVDEFQNTLARAPSLAMNRSYKSELKPEAPQQVTFEQLLIDAGVPPNERSVLLADSG